MKGVFYFERNFYVLLSKVKDVEICFIQKNKTLQ